MARRPLLALLLSAPFAVAILSTSLSAQGWNSQSYTVSAQLEADAETLRFPSRRTQALVLPEAVPAGEVCVDGPSATGSGRGRTQVRVVVSRLDEAGEDRTIQRLEFGWRRSDPPPRFCCRCQPLVPLLAGDTVEFRFRFFDMPPLRLHRQGRRVLSLPRLRVKGWVEQRPSAE